ncbi:hypothetical protein [Halomonas ventosae]|uniref:Helix-turn-helix protein n=1 Tax=Halomonas ventosae TaxID=229007 RepID=A0A2T0VL61_9GAMM|nr:hypothetical protein [Halomonas ventosae]PRY70990.1 hypothetical protein BCL64_11090 [Halomonas ventosae]
MAKAKKRQPKLPLDARGGVVIQARHMLESPQFLALSPFAKALVPLLQLHWRLDRPVDFGIREAAEKVGCSKDRASRAFKELLEAGFIEEAGESLFDSRYGSRTRSWRLTWMPTGTFDKPVPPSNRWEQDPDETDQPSAERTQTPDCVLNLGHRETVAS